VEDQDKPFSWFIKSSTGPTLLAVDAGVLKSDYCLATIPIAPYLSPTSGLAGVYNIVWTIAGFNIQSTVNGILQTTPLAFSLSGIPDSVLTSTLSVELKSYSATEGTAIVKLFKFSPT
jgi:hypothetical protein